MSTVIEKIILKNTSEYIKIPQEVKFEYNVIGNIFDLML